MKKEELNPPAPAETAKINKQTESNPDPAQASETKIATEQNLQIFELPDSLKPEVLVIDREMRELQNVLALKQKELFNFFKIHAVLEGNLSFSDDKKAVKLLEDFKYCIVDSKTK